MDSNHNVQVKPVYSHSHLSLYNSPVISATMPNLSLASGLNLVNGSANNNTSLQHEGNHLHALATLQASSTNQSLSISNTAAQLGPMTTLNNIQLQQMQHQSYLDQANNIRNNNQQQSKASNQFLQVHITAPIPSMAQANSLIQFPHNQSQNPISGTSITSGLTKKSSQAMDSGAKMAANQHSSSHRKSLNEVKSEASNDNLMNELSNKYAIINNGKGFRCLICNREFTQKGNLKTHAMTHLGPSERPYDCETCGKRFTQKGNRDIHVKIHTGTKDHTCPYCDRGFTQRGNLKTHIRSVHTGEKPFSCGHCGKSFSQKANMLTHFRTHDKNARFSCDQCSKTFSQKVSSSHNPL